MILPPPALRICGTTALQHCHVLDVRAHRIVPFGLADRLETATTKRTVERGVVDQDVDATELCRRIGHRLHGGRIGDLGADGCRVFTHRDDGLRRL